MTQKKRIPKVKEKSKGNLADSLNEIPAQKDPGEMQAREDKTLESNPIRNRHRHRRRKL